MKNQTYSMRWGDIAFKKRPFKKRPATFIAASRELSQERIKQLIQTYLPKGDMVWGVAAEDYVDGFAEQPQFRTLSATDLAPLTELTNAKSPHKIYALEYSQRDVQHVVAALKARCNVFVRGSWQYAMHLGQPKLYWQMVRAGSLQMVSPFASEDEAEAYAKKTKIDDFSSSKAVSLSGAADFMRATRQVARSSYDPSFQVGAILAQKKQTAYTYIAHAHNAVVPYETYAMHHGFARDENLSAPQDLNHYDTVHAETLLLVQNKTPKDAALFINVMPCPTCARAVVASGIKHVYYELDHSDGYALKLFAAAGIRAERMVPS